MRLKKAKLKDDQLEVTYTERLEDGSNKTVSETYDRKAHPDLIQAFKNLAIHLAILTGYVSVKQVKNIETPKEELTEGFHVSGISIKTGDDEGVVISGHRKLETGKAVILNTPFQRYTENEESAYKYTDDLIERVNRANEEITAYLNGTKKGEDAQQALAFPEVTKPAGNDDELPWEDVKPEDTTSEQIAQRLEDKTIWANGERPKLGVV
jgi:hypothetical protein